MDLNRSFRHWSAGTGLPQDDRGLARNEVTMDIAEAVEAQLADRDRCQVSQARSGGDGVEVANPSGSPRRLQVGRDCENPE